MALFDGVQNFTPAFQGQQLAIQAGQGAGQSISRGAATSQRGQTIKLEQDSFEFQKKKWNDEFKLQQDGMDDLTRSIQKYFGIGGINFGSGVSEQYAD